MQLTKGLLVEAAVVGVVLGVSLLILEILGIVRSPSSALLAGVVLGTLIHLGFEFSGANRWYCQHGAACAVFAT